MSNGVLSICLHQIAAISGIPKTALNAIRSTALLLKEVEEEAINKTVRSAFDSQITEFMSDMQLLIEDVKSKIDTHLKDALKPWSQGTATLPTPTLSLPLPKEVTQTQPNSRPTLTNAATSYTSVLINPPSHANPRLAAREGIKARQFLLFDEPGENAMPLQHDLQQLKAHMNKALRDVGASIGNIRSVIHQREGRGILIEVDSDLLAKWLANKFNRVEFCGRLGTGVTFKSRAYNIISFNVPLNINPENPVHREEINQANQLDENTVSAARWAKPTTRRVPNQQMAHLILSFYNPEAANRAISNGLQICNKNCHAARLKKEPLRCMKCQGWNHMAKQCEYTIDKCSSCGKDHKSEKCSHTRSKWCVSCKSNDHASWSRECLVFLRKMDELNTRHLENLMPFFPTDDRSTGDTDTIYPKKPNYSCGQTKATKL